MCSEAKLPIASKGSYATFGLLLFPIYLFELVTVRLSGRAQQKTQETGDGKRIAEKRLYN